MNTHTAIALAAAALMASTTAPSLCLAATHSTMAKPSNMSSTTSALTLTRAQRKTAWKDLHSTAITVTPPAKFAARVGVKVPGSVPMMQMSSAAEDAVPNLKAYDFTVTKGKLLIVNPKSRKIAAVISG